VPDLDSRPQVINIDHYAGDTLTLHVKVDSAVVAGRTWKAQVRSRPESQRVDAEFYIYENATGADVVLESPDCEKLAKRGKYTGYWDVQLAEANGLDPVTTLAYGKITVHTDVTRTSS
jgi:hypothetical protein